MTMMKWKTSASAEYNSGGLIEHMHFSQFSSIAKLCVRNSENWNGALVLQVLDCSEENSHISEIYV